MLYVIAGLLLLILLAVTGMLPLVFFAVWSLGEAAVYTLIGGVVVFAVLFIKMLIDEHRERKKITGPLKGPPKGRYADQPGWLTGKRPDKGEKRSDHGGFKASGH